MNCRREKGFVLLTITLCAFVLFGACGMAVDIGRMYVAKTELQNFADSAALAATLRLNGEATGIDRATGEVESMRLKNPWLTGSALLPQANVTTEFGRWSDAAAAPSDWAVNPGAPANYAYTKVTAFADVPVYFMAAVSGTTSARVASRAIAGQLASTNPQGLFPFTPVAHSNSAPDFGLIKGMQYTLKWASAPKLATNNVCDGDKAQKWIDLANSRGAENRGYFGDQTSASTVWDQVANDAPVTAYNVGDVVILSGGAKSTVKDALTARIGQDQDGISAIFADYRDRGHSRRLITAPISDPASVPPNRIVGYGRFFLLTQDKYQTAQGNDAWCAEYIGPAAPEGSDTKGASDTGAMFTKVRLWN